MDLTPRADGHASVSSPLDSAAQLEMLFDEAYDNILRFCLIRTGSRSVAEDITSAAFVDAARAAAADEESCPDVSWLFMVARRRLIDHWRSAERHRKRLRRIVDWRAVDDRVGLEDDPSANLVHEALASLPDRQRALLTLRYLDNCSVTEIADDLDLTYRAAESALARARRSFLAAWKEIQ